MTDTDTLLTEELRALLDRLDTRGWPVDTPQQTFDIAVVAVQGLRSVLPELDAARTLLAQALAALVMFGEYPAFAVGGAQGDDTPHCLWCQNRCGGHTDACIIGNTIAALRAAGVEPGK